MAPNPNTLSFALYPWFAEHGADFVHPEDLQRFVALAPYGRVFTVSAVDGEFVELGYGTEKFRVISKLLQLVPGPKFIIGQKIRCASSNNSGQIIHIIWHYKEEKPFYLIAMDGKPRSKRYWDNDLVDYS